jgi:hypothetical protein
MEGPPVMRDIPPEVLTPRQLRHQLRKLLHGVILKAISRQVGVRQDDGTTAHYAIFVWKEWFRGVYLQGGSTEFLDDEDYRTFIWHVEAHGAIAMNVTYPEQQGIPS